MQSLKGLECFQINWKRKFLDHFLNNLEQMYKLFRRSVENILDIKLMTPHDVPFVSVLSPFVAFLLRPDAMAKTVNYGKN